MPQIIGQGVKGKLQTINNLSIQQSNNLRPLLHGIVQGGLYPELREKSAKELIALDFDGYSVGGLAVDLETKEMWDIVKLMGEMLPANKQRYLMGVGTPDDIIKATALGMDMFDCVLPTRLARHGSVYIKKGVISNVNEKSHEISCLDKSMARNDRYLLINLLNSQYRTDGEVIDENCGCQACQHGKGLSRAYISHLLRSNEILGLRLTTLHNLWQYLHLMKELREVNT